MLNAGPAVPVLAAAILSAACGAHHGRGADLPVAAPAPAFETAPFSHPHAAAPSPMDDGRTADAESPVAFRGSLQDMVPEQAPSQNERGVDPAGRFLCLEPIRYHPGYDSADCESDGYAVRGSVVRVFETDGRISSYLDGRPEVERISRCGERVRQVRDPSPHMLRRIAPALVDLPLAADVDRTAFSGAACRDPRLTFEVPEGVAHFMVGTFHVFRTSSGAARVALRLDGKPVWEWQVGEWAEPDPCNRDRAVLMGHEPAMEILCNGDFAVVSGAVRPSLHWSDCLSRHDPYVARSYSPAACGIVPRWGRRPGAPFRLRLRLSDGAIEPLVPPIPATAAQ